MPWNVPAQVSASVITPAFWPRTWPRDPLDPTRHLGRGPAGESQQEDAARIGAVDDQMGHTMGQGVGLARAGSRDDQKWRSRK